jgi:hypothetical protein
VLNGLINTHQPLSTKLYHNPKPDASGIGQFSSAPALGARGLAAKIGWAQGPGQRGQCAESFDRLEIAKGAGVVEDIEIKQTIEKAI